MLHLFYSIPFYSIPAITPKLVWTVNAGFLLSAFPFPFFFSLIIPDEQDTVESSRSDYNQKTLQLKKS